MLQPVGSQYHQEEILLDVLRILGRKSMAAYVRKNWSPISSAQLRQRLSSLLCVAVSVRPGKDETPARGGEHPRLGFRIQQPVA